MAATCHSCEFHGACSGFFMGQATPEQRILENGALVCSVAQPVQEYICARLRDPRLFDALMARGAISEHDTPRGENPEM
jgi:hypothetical protein